MGETSESPKGKNHAGWLVRWDGGIKMCVHRTR